MFPNQQRVAKFLCILVNVQRALFYPTSLKKECARSPGSVHYTAAQSSQSKAAALKFSLFMQLCSRRGVSFIYRTGAAVRFAAALDFLLAACFLTEI